MIYKKICPICHKMFHALKISTTFCSKKCSNRTRYLPKHLVAALRHKVSPYSMTANDYLASIQGAIGESIKVGETVSLQAIEDLKTVARVHKREALQREEYERLKSLESSSGFIIPDNTTTSTPSGLEEESNTGQVMLSGVQDHKDIAQVVGGDNNNKPKKYKIKKIGGGL